MRAIPLQACRICGNTRLLEVLDLGEQYLTGVFPPAPDPQLTRGRLRLLKCDGAGQCGLLQLADTYDLGELYGDNYGYRSGLNPAMVAHLQRKVARIRARLEPAPGEIVLDIGANDGTTLAAWPDALERVGMDPTSAKFRAFFPPGARLVADFFSAERFLAELGGRQARVVTSFSMFYDLERPMQFMREVHRVLADGGLWVFEQSYMPAMLDADSYDTVCHEHLEFYGLAQVQWMAERVGFTLLEVEFNDVNGGSFSVTAQKSAPGLAPRPEIAALLERERAAGLDTPAPYEAFARRVAASRENLRRFVHQARAEGRRVMALGASTKGNVLLQYCGFGPEDIEAVGEVNPDKFGCVTPGSWIPIRPEAEVLASRPDFLLVLPWHFRDFFLRNERLRGHTLVFPLPRLEVVPPR